MFRSTHGLTFCSGLIKVSLALYLIESKAENGTTECANFLITLISEILNNSNILFKHLRDCFSERISSLNMNAYELLECTPASSQNEIKTSYHRLLLIHHPDKITSQNNYENSHSIDKFLKLQSAYKILSDPIQRLSYDSLLKQIDITNKANQLEANDEDCFTKKCFMLNRDFELNDNNQIYTKKCRCGSYYKISVNDLNRILESHQQMSVNNSPSLIQESLVINVECDTCSLNINVLTI